MVDKPKMVEVEAIKYHTNAGKEYHVGDTYEAEDSAIENLALQGMALRTDRVAVAKAQAAQAVKPAAKAADAKVAKPAAKAKKGRK